MEPKIINFAFFLCFLTVSVNSVPIEWRTTSVNQCSQQCVSDPQYLRYDSGKTYVYNLETKSTIRSLDGQTEQQISQNSVVEISALNACDMSLQLRDTRFQGLDSRAALELSQTLDSEALQFGYSDGLITDVCPSEDDQHWSLDIKKAIISALQMSARTLQGKSFVENERDILGECETTYEVIPAKFSKIMIQKTKRLNTCRGRQLAEISLFPKSYGFSKYSSLPLMNATYHCDQTLEADLITGATCYETLQLRGSDIEVVNQLNIRFEKQLSGITSRRMRQMSRSANHLLMSSHSNPSSNSEDLVQVLRQICQQLESDSQIERTVESFPQLVVSLENSGDVQRVGKSVEQKEICSSNQLFDLFLDASALAGTQQSVKVLLDAYQSQRISPERSNYLFSLLSFVSHPKQEAIQELMPLLVKKETPNHVALGISGYIHNWIESTSSGDQQVRQMRDKAVDSLLERFQRQEKDSDLVSTVKAIENVGTNEKARQQFLSLAKNQQKSDQLRSAAIKALKEYMIDSERQQLIEIFSKTSESNEIRINAYKSVVLSYPTKEQLQTIKDILSRDSNQEIKQYVRSHQKNLRKTQDPHKKYVLPSNSPQFEEPTSEWFGISNNFETSYMFDALSVGVAAEVDVIHTKEEMIPRSVTVNMTVPAFGREFQPFEVEIRQKGFANIFRNKYQNLKNKSPQNLLKELFSEAMNIVSTADQLSNQINSRDLQLQIYGKFDGKTIFSLDVSDLQSNNNQLWNKIKQQLSQRLDIDRAFAVQPINTRIQLPTTSGMPVMVRVNATFVSSLKASVKASDLSRNSNQKVFDAMIAPSIGLQFETAVEFMASNQKKAIEMVSKFSSSPVWDSKTEVRENRILNLKINLPKEKQTLLKAESRVYERDQNGQRMAIQNSLTNGWFGQRSSSQQKMCSQSLNKPLGLQICSQLNEYSYELSVEKSDRNMKSYELQIESPSKDKSETKNYRISFNTPNSQEDRHLAAELLIQNPSNGRKTAKIDIRSPWLRYSVEGGLRNEEKEQSVQMDVMKDGTKHFSIDLGLESQQRGQKREFRPRLRVQLSPQSELISMQGSVSVSKGRKNQLQINLEGNQKQFLKGSFVREGERKSSDIRISTDLTMNLSQIDMRLTGVMEKGAKHMETDLTMEYKLQRQRKESIKFSAKVQNLTQSQFTKASAFGEFTSTQYPSYNFHLAYNLLAKPEQHMENEFTLSWTQSLKNKIHIIHVTKISEQSNNQKNINNTLDVEITPLNVNYELRANALMVKDVTTGPKYTAEVFGKDKTGNKANDMKLNFGYRHVSRSPLHLTLDANLKTQKRDIQYRDELKEMSAGEYKGQTLLEYQKGKKAELEYNYKLKSGLDHEMDFKLKTPSNHIIRHSGLLKLSRNDFQMKSKLHSNDRQIYSLDSYLSRESPSQLEAQAMGYQLRADVSPYTLPQQLSWQYSTPNAISHKTSVEYIPRTSLALKSDTKQNLRNVLAIDSHISRTTPSRVVFTSDPIEGRVDCDLLDEKSAQIVLKSPTQDWTHSTLVSVHPNYELTSKTISRGKPILNINSLIGKSGQNSISLEMPQMNSHLSAELNRRQKNGQFLVRVNDFKHHTNFDLKNQIKINSETNKDRKQWNSLQYNYLNGVHGLNTQFNNNEYQMDLEGKHWNSIASPAVEPFLRLNLKNKRSQFETKVHKQQQNLKIESRIKRKGENYANLDAILSPEDESNISFNCPQIRTKLSAVPSSREARLEWNSPQVNHVSQIQWPEDNYSFDSKTQYLGNKYLNLNGRHTLKMSSCSVKSHLYDGSVELIKDQLNPRIKYGIQSKSYDYPYNHMTEIAFKRPQKQFIIDSKTNRNNENLLDLNGEYNHMINTPSTLTVKLGPHTQIKTRVQPYGQDKQLLVTAKHDQKYNHQTDIQLNKNVLTVKSRTDDNYGDNLAKIDSYLTPYSGERSHISWISPSYLANIEYEREKRVKLDLNANQIQHKTEVTKTPNGYQIQSKTTKSGSNVLDLNSAVNSWQEPSHLSVISPLIESQIIAHPSQNSGKIQIKTQTFEHKSELIPSQRSWNLNSKTDYNHQLLNQLSAKLSNQENNEFEFEVPHFVAKSQLNLNERSGFVDYKSKLSEKRHLLASVAFPRDGFRSDVAWDLDSDPNQRLIVDLSARQESGSGLWSKKSMVYVMNMNYAGNEVKLTSQMTTSDWIRGPHEWNLNYVPKYNPKRDSIGLMFKHVITSDNEMQCTLQYQESQRQKFGAKMNARLLSNGQSGVTANLVTTAPLNPDLEMKVTFSERHSFGRNAEFVAELKALKTSLNQQFSASVNIKRDDSQNKVKGEAQIETPSMGQKEFEFELSGNQLSFWLQNNSGKELEFNASYEPQTRSAQLELKSNVRGIPSISASGVFNEQELSATVDTDGQRKLDFALQRSGTNLDSGIDLSGRLETSFWPKIDSKNSFKVSRRDLDIQSKTKRDFKEVFAVNINAKKESNVWSGRAIIASNGAEVAKASMDSNIGTNSLSYNLFAKTKDLNAIKVQFSVQKVSTNERKVDINACNGDQCLDVKASYKTRYSNGFPESALISVTKMGTNFEIKTSIMEQMEENTGLSNSIFGLNDGSRVQQKIRNQFVVSINSHNLGFDSITTQRSSGFDSSLKMMFPSNRFIQLKTDFKKTSEEFVSKIQIQRELSQPLLETEVRLQDNSQRMRAEIQMTSNKFKRSPKEVVIEIQKPIPSKPFSAKIQLDLSRNPNNAITIEAEALQRPLMSDYNAKNTTLNVNIYTKDRRQIDLQVKSHVSSESFGINYVNTNRRGQKMEGMIYLRHLDYNQNLKRFEGFVGIYDQKYKVYGNWAQNTNELNLKFNNERTGETSDVRLAVNHNCVQWELKRISQMAKKYELCANLGSRGRKIMSLSLENNDNKRKEFDLNLDIDSRNEKQLKLSVDWSPEFFESPELFAKYNILLSEVMEEITHKWGIIAQQLDEDVIRPFVYLISDEFQDILQELANNFSQNRYWELLKRFTREVVDCVYQWIHNIIPDVNYYGSSVARSLRKSCKRSEMCYKTVYAFENYGFESLWDLLLSNAQQLFRHTHRIFFTTFGRLQQSLPSPPDWVNEWIDDWRQSVSQSVDAVIESNNDFKSVVNHFRRIGAEIFRENFDDINWNTIKESVNQLLEIVFSSQKSSSKVMVWDPKHGKIQLEFKSPIINSRRMRSLMDNVSQNKNWDQIKSMFS